MNLTNEEQDREVNDLGPKQGVGHIIEQGMVQKHEILDKTISAAYRKEIRATHMTFQVVPPDDHRRKLSEKAT